MFFFLSRFLSPFLGLQDGPVGQTASPAREKALFRGPSGPNSPTLGVKRVVQWAGLVVPLTRWGCASRTNVWEWGNLRKTDFCEMGGLGEAAGFSADRASGDSYHLQVGYGVYYAQSL